MPDYRVYTVDPYGNITAPPMVVSRDTDRAAIELARQWSRDGAF
jgi:hypothetical protein